MNRLWSGESVWCICGHHVEDHISSQMLKSCLLVEEPEIHRYCKFKVNEVEICLCTEFRAYKK